jgi:hypothetical protein
VALVQTMTQLSLQSDEAGIINLKKDSITLTGGGSEIKLANSSVTIGDLKITQVGGSTKLNLLKQSEDEIKKLSRKFEELEKSFNDIHHQER